MATRWGIASAGNISHDFVTAIGALPKSEHEVVAVAARDLSRAQTFADLHKIKKAYDNYSKLAEDKDIDVVYIGTLNPQHFEIAKLMLNNGKHVLCEKPLTMNLKQTTELINLAKSKKLFLMEAIWSRCFPAYETIKKEIESGSIGEIYQVVVSFGFKLTDIERLNVKKLGGGTVLDLGVYGIHFACFVFNNEVPHTVRASGCLNEDGVDMSVSANFLYKGNRTATIITHSVVDLPNEAYIIGTKGTIRVPQFWCPTTVILPNGETVNTLLPEGRHKFNFTNSAGLMYEANEVRECILKGMTESSKIPHVASLLIAQLEDEIRKQVGVVYDEDIVS
ncbi:PREDICTED: trans-1,2-dihydrobenzene-1,2-diol dehydrogenase-like [Dufourea novaeangliae]|uniref:Trans-1,2-dihydrobenzene-1,2-diol dehydrogenase n=1 Tax=Dufourea novaeangliae TaxID=178035 RepID=A0A154PMX1_DUFNO|nr:PREDICTED: trans-1,2-dihydrobenzene-1,2-diol dehydrogenase-like [Dufourea novaeangliae]XP_015435760.1 PREDICTED: trans-1,2-dihydrobenzene-1,2-diol dehydrogenase-like [Dufourea novaeangliae]XP_015435761.1 PREDICTED: trans-1,2-dihydrobenzene-1,2-diol dehydrogenase-like [Dufourea novaeangliae]KZC13216.1 Trans-1,2-dihydrobenzene-1,2-diol dehydrogenase [Dufourea novaeangliae]